MKTILTALVFITTATFSMYGMATGLATCDVPQEEWQSQDKLEAKLKEQGWQIRRIKEDGGCYEVYAMDADGKRVEAYFDPKTFERIPVDESKERR